MNRSNKSQHSAPGKIKKSPSKPSKLRPKSISPHSKSTAQISTQAPPSTTQTSTRPTSAPSRSLSTATKSSSPVVFTPTSPPSHPQRRVSKSISTSKRPNKHTTPQITLQFTPLSFPPLSTSPTRQLFAPIPFTSTKASISTKSHRTHNKVHTSSRSRPSLLSIFSAFFSTIPPTDPSAPKPATTPPLDGFAAPSAKLTKSQQESSSKATSDPTTASKTPTNGEVSKSTAMQPKEGEEDNFDDKKGDKCKIKNKLSIEGPETETTEDSNRRRKGQSKFAFAWEQFGDKHPFIARWLGRFAKLVKYTGMTTMFIACLAALSTQVLAHPMIAQPAKEMLQWESAAALAASVEQMAALGLIDLKLMPQSVLDAMNNPDNLQFGKDDTVIIEKPELGYFINSAHVFGDKSVVSTDSFPHHFDPINQAEPNLESYVTREAARDQFVALTKSMFEVNDYGSQQTAVKLQLLPVLINGYLGLLYDNPMALQLTSYTGQSILLPVERIVDILYLRDNGMNESFNEIVKSYPPEVFQNKRALEHGTHPNSYEIGAQVQHYSTSKHTPVGAMLQKLDDRFIKSLRIPEPDSPYIQDSPFKNELINIPEDIINHPDRTVTGPLFQYYYNILSRNAYTNVLVEENKVLVAMRDQLAQVADMCGLTRPIQPITGQSRQQLSDPTLTPYTAFFKASLESKINAHSTVPSDIQAKEISKTALNQTPLARQPFHHFYSTGATVAESNIQVPRFFKDITPISTAATDVILTPLLDSASNVKHQLFPPPEPATHIERFITIPRSLEADSHFNVDTSSMFKFTKSNDVMNGEWASFNALPPRYTFSDDLQLNPNVPPSDIQTLQRILTKIETTILRNQFELDRIKDVAGELNPDYAIHRAQKEEFITKQTKIIEDMMLEMQKQQEAALKASEGQDQPADKPWYQIW